MAGCFPFTQYESISEGQQTLSLGRHLNYVDPTINSPWLGNGLIN